MSAVALITSSFIELFLIGTVVVVGSVVVFPSPFSCSSGFVDTWSVKKYKNGLSPEDVCVGGGMGGF